MSARSSSQRREQTRESRRRSSVPNPQLLQHRYETATAVFREHFADIDLWLLDHAPHLWHLIRQEDEELFRLRDLGTSMYAYRTRLTVLLALFQQAEQLYYEAQPDKLRLPPLPEDARIAIYFEFADGTLRQMHGEDPA